MNTIAPFAAALTDTRGRPLRDLRISITDRCNFRCIYCMPKAVFGRDYPFLPKAEILSFEEIVYLSKIFVGLERLWNQFTGFARVCPQQPA